jgi:hypothetical protein
VKTVLFSCHSVDAAVSVTIVDCCVIHPSPLQKTDDAVMSEPSYHQLFAIEM